MKSILNLTVATVLSGLAMVSGVQAQNAKVNLTWSMWGDKDDAALWGQLAELVY